MKFIKILLEFTGREERFNTVTIESKAGMHELEIYTVLQKLMPAYFDINLNDPNEQEGYSYAFKNGLYSVSILRI
jgi:hypothetical protein